MRRDETWTLTFTTTERWSPGDGLHGWGLAITRAGVEVPPCCPEDVDGSGDVGFGFGFGFGFGDILAVLAVWGQQGGPEDLDGDETIGFGDLLVVLAAWGPCV